MENESKLEVLRIEDSQTSSFLNLRQDRHLPLSKDRKLCNYDEENVENRKSFRNKITFLIYDEVKYKILK